MSKVSSYPQYKQLNLPEIEKDILHYWKENTVFQKSIKNRINQENFVFFEGPPFCQWNAGDSPCD